MSDYELIEDDMKRAEAMSNMGFTLKRLKLMPDDGWIRWPLLWTFRKGSEL